MPIVISKKPTTFKKLSIKIPEDLLQKIQAYCETFSITDVNDFFIQAGQYVLKTDRDWTKANKKKAKVGGT